MLITHARTCLWEVLSHLKELANHCAGSIVTAGADRLEGAGRRGVPQLLAPSAIDVMDFFAWRKNPWQGDGRNYHAHNRLLASVAVTGEERPAAKASVVCLLIGARSFKAANKGR
jgi:uncharacterized protein (UPF0261 family)